MLFIQLFLITALHGPHDYHVGFYTFDFKENSCQITMKLFADDFERAFFLNKQNQKISDDLLEENASKAFQSYINSHFSMSLNDKKQTLTFVGAEWDDDYHAIYFFWETQTTSTNQLNLTIENSIFLEVSEEQQNMHHIKFKGKEHSLLLDAKKKVSSIEIN